MPTYAELGAEPWWNAEYEPEHFAAFLANLRAHYGHTRSQTGSKGDYRHLTGRHRSIAWCLNSKYCTDRSYGTRDQRDLRGDRNALRGFDLGVQGEELRAVSARVDAAVRAGELPELAEWFGTKDGKTVVGWFEGHASSSDSSHLWHFHGGVWTESVNDAEFLDRLYATITGDDMTPGQAWVLHVMNYRIDGIRGMRDPIVVPAREIGGQSFDGFSEPNVLAQAIKAIPTAAIPVDVDEAAIAAAVAEQLPGVGEIADAVNDDAAARLAD